MPGIVVAVGGFATDRLRAAVQKLVYLPSHHSEAVALSAELAIGWAGPRERIERQTWTGEPGHEVHVWRYGHTFKDAGQPQPISVAQILRDYMSEGIEACYAYEGAFVIVERILHPAGEGQRSEQPIPGQQRVARTRSNARQLQRARVRVIRLLNVGGAERPAV
jgi:hypothetical protein